LTILIGYFSMHYKLIIGLNMAKKYVNFRVGGSPYKVTDDYSVWTNDLLGKIIASKTVIQPGKSTVGHRLSDSDVVYIIVNGRGIMEKILVKALNIKIHLR
jgi:hypothetical protein